MALGKGANIEFPGGVAAFQTSLILSGWQACAPSKAKNSQLQHARSLTEEVHLDI